MDFEVVLFDTAPTGFPQSINLAHNAIPTGHTLRLRQFPTVIEKSLGRFLALKSQFLPMFSQVAPMLGLNDVSMDSAATKLEETLQIVRQINAEFKDPVKRNSSTLDDFFRI